MASTNSWLTFGKNIQYLNLPLVSRESDHNFYVVFGVKGWNVLTVGSLLYGGYGFSKLKTEAHERNILLQHLNLNLLQLSTKIEKILCNENQKTEE